MSALTSQSYFRSSQGVRRPGNLVGGTDGRKGPSSRLVFHDKWTGAVKQVRCARATISCNLFNMELVSRSEGAQRAAINFVMDGECDKRLENRKDERTRSLSETRSGGPRMLRATRCRVLSKRFGSLHATPIAVFPKATLAPSPPIASEAI